jgi:hypothetical protein
MLRSACLFFLLTVTRLLAAAPTGELVDKVWAGHPVSFALLTERGHQFIAYYDAERRLTVAGRKLGETTWTRVQPAGVPSAHQRDSNLTGWDSHNYLRLALDRAGCLHVSGNMHNDPLVYYRSGQPFDVATLARIDRMTGEREARCTYPVFFTNAAGDLLFRYRDGGSGNGSDLYNIYDEKSHAWRRMLATPLLEGEGQRNAYALDPMLGPDGRFHLVWMWRETPDCSTNNNLSYARSRDFIHWENSRGEPIALPITRAKGEVIDPAQPKEGLINMTFNLGFDAAQRPVVVYHRYDAQHRSQAYAARPRASGWDITQLSAWDFTWAFSGAGRWRVNSDTLKTTAQLPAAPAVLPADLLATPTGYEVQTVVSRDHGRRYVLRWETLPRNRDLPRDSAPPPAELRLYELPDTDAGTAARVGS